MFPVVFYAKARGGYGSRRVFDRKPGKVFCVIAAIEVRGKK